MDKARTIREIDQAIGAHTRWKMRLRTALATGEGNLNATTIGRDDCCAFGQWLHGAGLDAEARASAEYEDVRRLHAHFHASAGCVVDHIDCDRRDLAGDVMLGEFAERSDRLIHALKAWKAALRQDQPTADIHWEGQLDRRINA
jgi:methyl-accepting chemotaxis protein